VPAAHGPRELFRGTPARGGPLRPLPGAPDQGTHVTQKHRVLRGPGASGSTTRQTGHRLAATPACTSTIADPCWQCRVLVEPVGRQSATTTGRGAGGQCCHSTLDRRDPCTQSWGTWEIRSPPGAAPGGADGSPGAGAHPDRGAALSEHGLARGLAVTPPRQPPRRASEALLPSISTATLAARSPRRSPALPPSRAPEHARSETVGAARGTAAVAPGDGADGSGVSRAATGLSARVCAIRSDSRPFSRSSSAIRSAWRSSAATSGSRNVSDHTSGGASPAAAGSITTNAEPFAVRLARVVGEPRRDTSGSLGAIPAARLYPRSTPPSAPLKHSHRRSGPRGDYVASQWR
jgi:hypothetical protein